MKVLNDSTQVSIYIRLLTTAGLPYEMATVADVAFWYWRGGGKVAFPPVIRHSLTDEWMAGGFIHIDDGYYRLDVPDAAFEAGAGTVLIGGSATGGLIVASEVTIDDGTLADIDSGMTTLLTSVAGLATSSALAVVDVLVRAVKAKTDLIGTGTLEIVSDGFTQDGLLRITRGDSYGVGHGRPALSVIDTEDNWPDISDAILITLTVRHQKRVDGVEPAVQLTATGQAGTAGGHKSVSFVVPAEDTASMTPGPVEWDIQAEWADGSVATIAGPEATGIVRRDQTTT